MRTATARNISFGMAGRRCAAACCVHSGQAYSRAEHLRCQPLWTRTPRTMLTGKLQRSRQQHLHYQFSQASALLILCLQDPNYNAADNEWSATGSGDLLNDVWYTTGASWEVFTDERIRGPYNDPYPTIISKASWTAAPKWEVRMRCNDVDAAATASSELLHGFEPRKPMGAQHTRHFASCVATPRFGARLWPHPRVPSSLFSKLVSNTVLPSRD